MSAERTLQRRGGHAPGASATDRRRALGQLGEDLATAHFQRLGYSVIARNVRTRHGEIDLIVLYRGTLVFVEVKTRRAGARRLAAEEQPLTCVSIPQRVRLRRLATGWLSEETNARASAHTLRFDAVGVIVDGEDRLVRLDHLEAAW